MMPPRRDDRKNLRDDDHLLHRFIHVTTSQDGKRRKVGVGNPLIPEVRLQIHRGEKREEISICKAATALMSEPNPRKVQESYLEHGTKAPTWGRLNSTGSIRSKRSASHAQ